MYLEVIDEQFKIDKRIRFPNLYSDGDWNDPWEVGFISDMRGEYFRIASSLHPLRFKYAVKISQKVGDRILNDYPKLEGTSFDQSTKEEIFKDS